MGIPLPFAVFPGKVPEMGLGQGLGKAARLTCTCPSPCRAEQHDWAPGPGRGPRQLPQHPQPPQWPQQPLPHRGAACGQLGPVLRAAATGPTGPGLLHCKPWGGIGRADGSGHHGGKGGGWGMGEGMAGVSGWPDLDSSVGFLIQPFFGTHCSSPNWEVSFSLPLFPLCASGSDPICLSGLASGPSFYPNLFDHIS